MPLILRWLLNLGPTNPIAVRLVQNGSRRSRHMYMRASYLGVLIVALLYALLWNTKSGDLSYRELASAGSLSFQYIAYLQVALICILAPVFMAGAIAQEADPKTWDILLTTPLSATQIVLGNLLGRLFFILALLFSSLPLFATTQYFGGVPGRSIFASYLIAACAALLVGAAAIALSVSRLVGRRAVFTFYIGVVSYVAVTIAIDTVRFGGATVSWVTALNPFLTLRALLDPSGYPRAAAGSRAGLGAWFLERPVTTWCLLSAGFSVVLVLASIATVRLGGFTAITGNVGVRRANVLDRLLRRGSAAPGGKVGRTVWHNPVAWREAAARNASGLRVLARYVFIGAGIALGAVIVWFFHSGSLSVADFRAVLLYVVLGEMAVIALVVLNMSATCVSREREDGTLDLLLTTPIQARQYLWGKIQGLMAYAVPMLAAPLATMIIAGAYVGLGGFGRGGGVSVASTYTLTTPAAAGGGTAATAMVPVVLPEAGLVAAIVAVPFVAFCAIIGIQFSLKSKGTIGSVMATVGVVAVVAGTIGLCAWNAGSDLPLIGPVLAGLSPASAVFATVQAEDAMARTIQQSDLAAARVGLLIGSLVGACVYGLVVYMMHASMTRTFDMTVRKLAGTR
ncbi:MAG: ABC transporter permease [Phycisphaerales bacterium]